MKITNLVGLALLAQLQFGCDSGGHRSTKLGTASDPDSVKLERVSAIDSSKSRFMYMKDLRIPAEPIDVPLAKLVNAEEYEVVLGGDGVTFQYRLLTFNVQGSSKRFLSDKIMDYSRGGNFVIKYWKIPEDVKLTSKQYFETFMDRENNFYMSDYYSKDIDENIEGVIKDMHRLEVSANNER